MKKALIHSINSTLEQAIFLLDIIDVDVYNQTSVGPYYSSIGSHIRHILDFFDCIKSGLDDSIIDLTARKRDVRIAVDPEAAHQGIRSIQHTLTSYIGTNTDYLLHVTDDMGHGKVTVNYTLESILAHANSHALHHYAIIGYIMNSMGITYEIPGFGYNPSTPISKRSGI
ncbi:DinB family protein [Aquimarina sp. W85]|uniref:DinB family protein n=1 Tax=Aquimarina rhodophyticola TaxID=3342246 RepID=UPI00366BAD03